MTFCMLKMLGRLYTSPKYVWPRPKSLGLLKSPALKTKNATVRLGLYFSTNGICVSRPKLSYVEKIKYLQHLKEDPQMCLNLLPKGKFLIYSGSRPFLQTLHNYPEDSGTNPIWLSYADLSLENCEEHIASSWVLLDIDEYFNPMYSIQLGKLEDSAKEQLEKSENGTFFDLRAALFLTDLKSAHYLSQANALLMFHKRNKYCGTCGEKMERNCSGHSRTCSNCKNVVYPSCHPVGIVLVTDVYRLKALLVRQPRHPPGMYSCIAGFNDVGESLEDTVRREVAEEVGVEVSQIQYMGSQHWPFPGSLMAGCYAVTHDTKFSIDEAELEDARWFSREEIEGALDRIERDPSLLLMSDYKGQFYVPRRGAIAYSLIKHWCLRTPAEDFKL